MKKINIAAILDKYSRNDGCTSVKDLYQNESVDEIVYGDFIDSVEVYLDAIAQTDTNPGGLISVMPYSTRPWILQMR